jgi:hypothetical protein
VSLTIGKFHLPVKLTYGYLYLREMKLTYCQTHGYLYLREMKLIYNQAHLRLPLPEGDER